MQCVILAGGLGTRMWPEARTVPKTLLPVAGRPFAAWQLEWLGRSAVNSVVYCVGYLAADIQTFVGDGSDFGVKVSYVDEGQPLRGTAGALRLAFDEGALEEDFLVLYGDSWLQVDPAAVLAYARTRTEPALMTVYRNDDQWDTSNTVFVDGRVVRYEKGLQPLPAQMRWIDYGLSTYRRNLIAERVPAVGAHDLAPLCTALAASGELAGFEVTERFYEIGSARGRADMQRHLYEKPPW
jgi:NDP-sugar pyrophosphorylase family protein